MPACAGFGAFLALQGRRLRGELRALETLGRSPTTMRSYRSQAATIVARFGKKRPADLTVREGRWMLSMVRDATGNEINYEYEKVTGAALNATVSSEVDISLLAIEYGVNDDAALASHARIEFTWSGLFVCPGSYVPKGAEFSYRNGIRTYRGARRLADIHVRSRSSATASFTTRRRISLAYDADAGDCAKPRAPLRVLSSITQTV